MQKAKRKQNIKCEQVYKSRMYEMDTVLSLGQQRGIAEYVTPVQGPGMHRKVI